MTTRWSCPHCAADVATPADGSGPGVCQRCGKQTGEPSRQPPPPPLFVPLEELQAAPSWHSAEPSPARGGAITRACQGVIAGFVIGIPTGWLGAAGLQGYGYPVPLAVFLPAWLLGASCLGGWIGVWVGPGGGASQPEFFCILIGVVLGALGGLLTGPLWAGVVPGSGAAWFDAIARTVFGVCASVLGSGLLGAVVGFLLGSRWAWVRRGPHGGLLRVDPLLDPSEADRRAGI